MSFINNMEEETENNKENFLNERLYPLLLPIL